MRRFYERWVLNPKAKTIAKSMRDHPERWRNVFSPFDGRCYTVDCGPLEVWMNNGWLFVRIQRPTEERLGVIGRTIVWWRARKIYVPVRPADYSQNEAAIRSLEGER